MKSTKVIWILQTRAGPKKKWKQWSAYETRSRARESQKAVRPHYDQGTIRNTRVKREEVK